MQNRFPRILILTVAVILLFVLTVGGYSWWLTRPVSGILVAPVSKNGHILLTARSRQSVLPENEMIYMPGILRIFSRMHRIATQWELQKLDGKAASEIELNIAFEHASTVTPETLGPDRLLAATRPDTIAVFDLSGRRLNQYTFKGFSVRCLAASPNGQWIAWAVSLARNIRASEGSLNRDPYDVTMPPPSPGQQPGAFLLFVADRNLERVRQINIAGTYPAFVPGSMAWDASPALYYTGYDTGNHEWRTTYRVDPKSGAVQPVAPKRDWGSLFALSPNGDTAASVGRRGLTLTGTTAGDQKHLWPGAPSESVLPSWDAAGRRVAFLLKPLYGPTENGDQSRRITQKDVRVVIADTSTGKFHVMSEPIATFTCGACRPVWSPDGKRVFMNGTVFEERSRGLVVTRRVVLCFDTVSGAVTYPADFRTLWK